MNKKIIIIICICAFLFVLALVTTSIIILLNRRTNYPINIVVDDAFMALEPREEFDMDEYKLYKSYNELSKNFEVLDIKASDFDKYNYLVLKIAYNSCGEDNIVPTSHKINGNNIDVVISYEARCGVCAPLYLYYAIKLDKKITSPKVNIDYNATNNPHCDPNVAYKPMIYLYPESTMEVKVTLKNKELLTTTYPKYNDSWNVIANPDGTLIDPKTGRNYYGLYWEGINYTKIDETVGFVFKGEDSIIFLEDKLYQLGLNDKEAEEFIVYWLPKLEKNKYNYVYFADTSEVNFYMPLEITPKANTLIRILMYYKPLNNMINVKTQELSKVNREGFTVVEWGGTELK